MYFRAIRHVKLDDGIKTTGAGTEVDLSANYVEPGKREIAAVFTAVNLVSSDSAAMDYKIQESATTVDSDFTDITGAAFTSLSDASTPGPEVIYFNTTKRYVRGYATIGGSCVVYAELMLTKRDA